MWKPILEGQQGNPYRELCAEILHTINSGFHGVEMQKMDMMYGTSGFMLYYAYLDRFTPQQSYEYKVEELIEKTFDLLTENADGNLSLGQGAAGAAWVFQHLINYHFIEADFEEIFSEIMEASELYSIGQLYEDNYDYLLGGLGYFLLILDSKRSEEQRLPYVTKIIHRLQEMSHIIAEGKIAWPLIKKLQDFNDHDRVYNLGLSHGTPGILILLAMAYEQFDALKDTIRPMIEQAISWVLSLKVQSETCCFGYSVINGVITENGALRWCYGDMGIAVCLFITGQKLNNKQWQEEGINTMKQCAARLQQRINHIADAHMCHGVAGVGHMFNRFYQYTQIAEFKEAALLCLEAVLSKVDRNEDNNVIFKADKGDFGFIPFGGLMEGSAGIALILLAAISDVEPTWDRAFLLS